MATGTMICSLSNELAGGDPGYWIKDYRSIYTHTAHYGRQRDRVRRTRKRIERRALKAEIREVLS